MSKFLIKMLYALTSAYSRKDYENCKRGLSPVTAIGKLFSIFAWGLDLAEEQALLVREWDDLDKARGTVLDRYGANFGVKRNGADDQFYRLLIKVKVMAQLSGGDTDTVIRAAAALFGVPFSSVTLDEVFPAKVWVAVDEDLLTADQVQAVDVIAAMLKRIVSAGVGFRLFLRRNRSFESSVVLSSAAYSYSRITIRPTSRDRDFTCPLHFSSAACESIKVSMRPTKSSEIGGTL